MNFELKELSFGNINNGKKYKNGDVVDATAINSAIEASAWAQNIAKTADTNAANALKKVNSAVGDDILRSYPIGSIYISANATSPAELFGGRWDRLQDVFLLAASNTRPAGVTNGSFTQKLTLRHFPANTLLAMRNVSGATVTTGTSGVWKTESISLNQYAALEAQSAHLFGYDSYGEQKSIDIMPYHKTVYMWQRTG